VFVVLCPAQFVQQQVVPADGVDLVEDENNCTADVVDHTVEMVEGLAFRVTVRVLAGLFLHEVTDNLIRGPLTGTAVKDSCQFYTVLGCSLLEL
jgi:hypothetical protein